MLKEGMYVRCPVDAEDTNNPRDFALAQIVHIDDMAGMVKVNFFDSYNARLFYQMPDEYTYPLHQLVHAKIHVNSIVKYRNAEYTVKACMENKEDEYYYYYLTARKTNLTIKVCEKDLRASFNDSEINPYFQMIRYEFQNPTWFFGRRNVSQTMQAIQNAIYGFKELSGCKIYLKPYQLKTVMRCLQQKQCRNMIADEVGLGKTIEAASVLKIYMTDHRNAKIVILVPDALTEQWKTELAFKFNIFESADQNGNRIRILPFSRIPTMKTEISHDFLIVDEVHQCLKSEMIYERVLELSRNAKNVLMLSATPVQDRKNEYYRLIRLIQPEKYGSISEEAFEKMLAQQSRIVRNVYEALGSLEDYQTEIEDADGELSEDAQDVYDDELVECFEKISKAIQDDTFSEIVDAIDIHAEDFGVSQMQTAIAYVSEHYQLERCIIRNRRNVLDENSSNQRVLKTLPYDLTSAYNNTQLQIYRCLSEWLEESLHTITDIEQMGKPLISALFSSPSAFYTELQKLRLQLPVSLQELSERWRKEELRELKQVHTIMKDPFSYPSRMITILDYIDQEAYDKKVLLFTNFSETFQVYQKALSGVFGKACCFFRSDMSTDELELQTYRFQTDKNCRIMLSDESGGEGRNFQKADILIHIDLPWNANTLEQRIGRLDRIGREADRPVVSVVTYAQETLEEDLFRVWSEGLQIFEQSQSGLEIIMNEIDEKILHSISEDMKYGLTNMIPQLMEDLKRLKQTVKTEQHFDVAAYQYQALNQQLDRSVRLYTENETELFTSSMLSWSNLTGFRGREIDESMIRFDASSFSVKSAQNTCFVPPDMKAEIEHQLNQLQNHIRELNDERDVALNPHFIQGTFDRKKALSNDYLHFFAPGDAIFDSIVQNALYSYKGRCAAIAIPAEFDWSGLVFTWQLRPNEAVLFENNLDVRMLNQYMGYLPGQLLTNAISFSSSNTVGVADVLKVFQGIGKLRLSKLGKHVEHLGKRTPKSPILGIKDKYRCADVDWFRQKYPSDKWQYFVRESYQQAKKEALEELRKKTNMKALRSNLLGEISTHKAALAYFSREESVAEMERTHELLLEAFRKSKIELDSICFVRMVKQS